MLSITEQLAYKWLLSQGYKKEEIIKNHKSPDFICSDGKRFEVKLIYGKSIMFYDSQIKQLKNTDFILVFDRAGLMISKFQWGDRKSQKRVDVKTYKREGTMIIVSKATRKRLQKQKINKLESYDLLINRLLDLVIAQ